MINLKRENILKKLLDDCLQNANHYLIYENADLFISIFDKMDRAVKKEILIMEAIIRNIAKGNVTVVEHKFVREEILRCSKSGNLTKIR